MVLYSPLIAGLQIVLGVLKRLHAAGESEGVEC